MTSSAVILDGYVDEPACLGVPPYLSPYIRTCAGVLFSREYAVRYLTIDRLRQDPALLHPMERSDLVLVIAGLTVPGKYLGGTPATLTELEQVGTRLREPVTVLGGPVLFGSSPGGGRKAIRREIAGYDVRLQGSPAEALSAWLEGGESVGRGDYARSDRWAVEGAPVIRQHPDYPRVMCEMETGTGCHRAVTGGCSFCTEPFYGPPRFRSPAAVAAEAGALFREGARHFRLGRQADLLTYGVAPGEEFPRPDPGALEALFAGIRAQAPDLSTLHIDNVNPGTIARHEEESAAALEVIVRHHTAGDVAAFGMETADPEVVASNNLKAMPGEVMRAIEVVNRVGARRRDGIPELLPGLNFVIGLEGESKETFALNRAFLEEVSSRGLLVRRVNLRQLMPFPGTRAFEHHSLGKHDAQFRRFKEWVRREFDRPMLSRVFPAGTVIRSVEVEVTGPTSFGRPMGSYPILVGIPVDLATGTVLDTVVVDWGMRSVTALPFPVDVNRLPLTALRWLPGVGRKRAGAIAVARPFRSLEEFRGVAGTTPLDGALSFRP